MLLCCCWLWKLWKNKKSPGPTFCWRRCCCAASSAAEFSCLAARFSTELLLPLLLLLLPLIFPLPPLICDTHSHTGTDTKHSHTHSRALALSHTHAHTHTDTQALVVFVAAAAAAVCLALFAICYLTIAICQLLSQLFCTFFCYHLSNITAVLFCCCCLAIFPLARWPTACCPAHSGALCVSVVRFFTWPK